MKLFSSDIGHLTYHSKRLAYLLRHSKLPNHKGWIKVDVVQNELGVLLLDIQKIVYEDTKGRFEFSEDKSSVRALYGHSIDVNLGLEPTIPPPILYHGTAEKYIDSIMKEGLTPRKRNFVHLSETMDMAKQVGTRHGSPVVLSIDIEAMIRAGYKFYKAQNGIWLTGDILPNFFKIVCYE
ncbi:RNA 2'-phosphotransferase [Barnesiella viscericola]|uniref:RNA 2'-phosphotransferase n=1 Tax=Barnesiella viscericola TaxID=397865 RepID=UPI0025A3C0F1|nr:RNA 2'-phosphotransferase [Barnesiella viscericola]MDM8267793.1 RNA 2'-phosphotransferase [Barnesiella viscericola]